MRLKDVPVIIVVGAFAGVFFNAKAPPEKPPATSAAGSPPALAERASLTLAREKPACSCTMNEALAEAILASPE